MWLGLDIGGSKTAWAVLGPEGVEDQGISRRGLAFSELGEEGAGAGFAALLADLLAMLGKPFGQVVAGVAGAGDAATCRKLEATVADGGPPLRVVGDVVAAATAALADEPGVVVWAGTGSFAVARSEGGGLRRVGGRGWLLDDDGSAFDLVRRAGRAALAAADGLGPGTSLTGILSEELGTSPERIGAVAGSWPVARLAALAPRIIAEAEGGDAVARRCVREAAHALAGQAGAVADRAGLDRRTSPVVFGGGLLESAGPIGDALIEALVEHNFAAPPQRVSRSAAEGAALLARACSEDRKPLASWVE